MNRGAALDGGCGGGGSSREERVPAGDQTFFCGVYSVHDSAALLLVDGFQDLQPHRLSLSGSQVAAEFEGEIAGIAAARYELRSRLAVVAAWAEGVLGQVSCEVLSGAREIIR